MPGPSDAELEAQARIEAERLQRELDRMREEKKGQK